MTSALRAMHFPAKKKSRGKPRLIRRPPRRTPLKFTPYAWAKLHWLRDAGPTEIGGFGISSSSDLLLVEDVQLVRQTCDWASVQFDDASVADFFDQQVELGRRPEQIGRIWVHTHPGSSPKPSMTDEQTFARAFGSCDWAVMFILACGGASYARLQFRAGPGGAMEIPVEVAFEAPFSGADHAAWDAEYAESVLPATGAREFQDELRHDVFLGTEEWDWLSEPLPSQATQEVEAADATA